MIPLQLTEKQKATILRTIKIVAALEKTNRLNKLLINEVDIEDAQSQSTLNNMSPLPTIFNSQAVKVEIFAQGLYL